MNIQFTNRDGIRLVGRIIREYSAFEGGMRYIFETADGRQYRCIKVDGQYVEYVA